MEKVVVRHYTNVRSAQPLAAKTKVTVLNAQTALKKILAGLAKIVVAMLNRFKVLSH